MGDEDRQQHEELEVKFYVNKLGRVKDRIQSSGARLIQPRTHEYNLLFDNTTGDLTQMSQLLRLRKDTEVRLTFKGRKIQSDEIHLRPEIEFAASSFVAAQEFLEALGYQVCFVYEKYRATYDLHGVSINLDEMPIGNFIEVEGPSSDLIHEVSAKLKLDWDKRILQNYRQLFEKVQSHIRIPITDLTFADFSAINVLPTYLGVKPADG